MLKGRWRGLVVVACCASACGGGGDDPPTSSQSSASTGAPDGGSDAAILPAVYAGTSTEQGPGLPYDFTGAVTESLPLTTAEKAAVSGANAKEKLRVLRASFVSA